MEKVNTFEIRAVIFDREDAFSTPKLGDLVFILLSLCSIPVALFYHYCSVHQIIVINGKK